MRVGLVVYGSLDSRSGGYLYDRKLVEFLREAGDTVVVVSLPWRSYPLHLADNLSAGLFERMKRLEVDILIQDELNHPSLFALNRQLRPVVAYPTVALVHHLRISEQHPALPMLIYPFVERAYLRSVDGFICNSRTTEAVVGRHARTGTPAVVAVPGRDSVEIEIEPETIARRAEEPGPLRVLFVGSLTRRKGLHTLLAALERLRPETWTLTVVGGSDAEPGYADRQRAFVDRRGWGERVRFAGYVEPAGLAGLLLRHHVLAGPSQYEGYGIAHLEGLGAGLAVIASTGGGAGEFIRDGENGLLVDPEDPGGLADLLSSLNEDRAMLVRLGVRARASYIAHPTWGESMAVARDFLVGLKE